MGNLMNDHAVPGTKLARLYKSLAVLVPGAVLFLSLLVLAAPAEGALVSQWKLDGNSNDSAGTNNGTVMTYLIPGLIRGLLDGIA